MTNSNLKDFDDLFQSSEPQVSSSNQSLQLSVLQPFKKHPFKLHDAEKIYKTSKGNGHAVKKFRDSNKAVLFGCGAMWEENIIMLETECNSPNEAVKKYMEFKDIADIDRNTLTKLVNEIYIDNEKNVTIDFKFKDEIKQYCSLLE